MQNDLYQWAHRHGVSAQAQVELMDMLDPSRQTMITGGGSSEASVQASCRVAAPRYQSSLWRNNTGAVTTDDGRHVRFGLGNDSTKLNKIWKTSDLIGITPVRATRIGQVFGVFTAVECKTPGWSSPKNDRERAQGAFHNTVRSMGGIALFAQSVADYEGIFKS